MLQGEDRMHRFAYAVVIWGAWENCFIPTDKKS